MEWTVVTALVVVVGLFITVGTPIIKLNSNIVKLNMNIDALRAKTEENAADLKEQKEHAHESHQKLWDHNAEQDKTLNDHENRIQLLEHK